jgi:hypothetical protein
MKKNIDEKQLKLIHAIAELKDKLRAEGWIYQVSLYGTLADRQHPERKKEKRIEIFMRFPATPEKVRFLDAVFTHALPLSDYAIFTLDENLVLKEVTPQV